MGSRGRTLQAASPDERRIGGRLLEGSGMVAGNYSRNVNSASEAALRHPHGQLIFRARRALCSLILCKITVTLDLRGIRSGQYHYYVPKRPCSLAGPLRHQAPGAQTDKDHSSDIQPQWVIAHKFPEVR